MKKKNTKPASQPTHSRQQGAIAVGLMQQGKAAEALAMFEAILARTPDVLAVQQNVVLCHLQLGNYEQVVTLARPLVAATPDAFVMADALAQALAHQDKFNESLLCLAQAMQRKDCPDFIRERYVHVLQWCASLEVDFLLVHDWVAQPTVAVESKLKYAILLAKKWKFQLSFQLFKAIEKTVDTSDQPWLQSQQIAMHVYYFTVAMEVGNPEEGWRQISKLEALNANEEQVLLFKAQYDRYIGQVNKSIDTLHLLLQRYPENVQAWGLLGKLLLDAGQVEASLKAHQSAMQLAPANLSLQHSAALTAMAAADDLRVAWQLYEGRWYTPIGGEKSRLPWPEWKGERSGGKLFLYREQGLGDEIFWASMFDELCTIFDCVVYVCHAKLITLFARAFPNIIFVPDSGVSHPLVFEQYDYQLPIGSLATYLRPQRRDFASTPRSFLIADPVRAGHWRQRFALLGPELKVGIAWRSGKIDGDRARYYPSLAALQPLLQLPGVCFINLQYQITPAEVEEMQQHSHERFHDFCEIDHFNDLDASVAMMAACDIVVSPSTSTAALAAAVGVPVLDMMAVAVEGMHLGQQQSPWLPMLTLFGKLPDAPWTDSVNQVAAVVAQLVKDRGPV